MRPTETIALRREPGHVIRSLVALLLRVGLGMIFLMAGLQKLDDMSKDQDPPLAEVEDLVVDSDEAEAPATPPVAVESKAPAEPRYPETIRSMFADTWLGRDLKPALDLYTAFLPMLEVAVGALLIAGLFTTLSAFLSGLLLLSLTFGWIVLQNTSMYPTMIIYLLVNSSILWLSPITSNYLSLDGLLFGWFWKPSDEGEYRREYEAPIRS
ncbi:DoxX family membrane protein [Tautonia rosea]|uniref:DoxX family membrane protein n=1 Tax=Tautonia rosea TaxID=2728037 RepID=UPI0014760D96|nr:DoxX family membrane protein [Tautonia rosea]